MKIDWKYAAIALLAIAWYHDAKLGMSYRRRFKTAILERNALRDISLLYAGEMQRNQIPMSEFEAIAVREILSNVKKS